MTSAQKGKFLDCLFFWAFEFSEKMWSWRYCREWSRCLKLLLLCEQRWSWGFMRITSHIGPANTFDLFWALLVAPRPLRYARMKRRMVTYCILLWVAVTEGPNFDILNLHLKFPWIRKMPQSFNSVCSDCLNIDILFGFWGVFLTEFPTEAAGKSMGF